MTIYDGLNLIGGLALFLFGMNTMGSSLEKRAGNQLKGVLGRVTSNKLTAFLLGVVVTVIMQSSSASTVMVVGFVNSGLMTLDQATGVIFGANLGTTVTSWILSLTGIEGDSLLLNLLKPTSFTPLIALAGIGLYMFQKNKNRRDTGLILLGFSLLMFGMEMMSSSVKGLQAVPGFTRVLTMFENPILGVLVGAAVTAVIQSSAASIGILQALTVTGGVTYSAAIPIVMGQNIGTCVTALISSAGTNRNAKRAAVIHLSFNVIATVVLLPLYYLLNALFQFPFASAAANQVGIAILHTVFKLAALALLMPLSGLLEKLACFLVRDKASAEEEEHFSLLDERLLTAPGVALERSRTVTAEMTRLSVEAMTLSLDMLGSYDKKTAEKIRANEELADKYEDRLGSYLLKISNRSLSEEDSARLTELLHLIGDLERISDHAVNMLESAEEIRDKKISFSGAAKAEIGVLTAAIREILDLSARSFVENDLSAAVMVEPLEQVIDKLEDRLKHEHINRLKRGECSIEMGFILSDILGNLERVSDHCSNIAGCILETGHGSMDVHSYLRGVKSGDSEFTDYYTYFDTKYSI